MRLDKNECIQLSVCGERDAIVFEFVEEALVGNFVECFFVNLEGWRLSVFCNIYLSWPKLLNTF